MSFSPLYSRREILVAKRFFDTNCPTFDDWTLNLISGVRRSALRQSRYIGLAKTHLQHIFMAAGLNLCRLNNWLNSVPLATTRYSEFMTLKPKAS